MRKRYLFDHSGIVPREQKGTIANPTHIIVITKSAEFELFRGSKEVPFSRNFECE